ncbi:MAG: hypothetical protein RBT76_00760 [candidate division Zixibacteria bacterium]|jgi:hypothetical protein|nr:hypothetical protein [candidate division Zixibacteria bacterium]
MIVSCLRKTAFALLLVVAALDWSKADVPNRFSYQGRLTDATGTALPDGSKGVRFVIYNDPTSSNPVNVLWDSGPTSVTTTDGLFSVTLGEAPMPSFPSDLFADSMTWLGITVGADPELSPRTRVAAVPYAMHAGSAEELTDDQYVNDTGDVITGDLQFDGPAHLANLQLLNQADHSNIAMRYQGNIKAWLSSSQYGSIFLYDISDQNTAFLSSGASLGGSLQLYNPTTLGGVIALGGSPSGVSSLRMVDTAGTYTHQFLGVLSGDASTVLPPNAINSNELVNEPGLAANRSGNIIELNSSTTMQDLTTVTITTPTEGYIFLQAHCWVVSSNTTANQGGYIQIDETAGGSIQSPYYSFSGADGFFSTQTNYYSNSNQRVYFKSAGTYTFRLEGRRWTNNGVVAVWFPSLTAIFLPTSYGSVTTLASSSGTGGFESVVLLGPSNVPSVHKAPNADNLYEVDLRELELRAARARAELERARAEADRAEMDLRMEQERRMRDAGDSDDK